MPRTSRKRSRDFAHHITVRCLDGRRVIVHGSDAAEYLARLKEVAAKYGWIVAAFNVLGNHVHFIVWTPEGGLGRGMKELQEGFARWANERDGLTGRGHFWSERYDNRLLRTKERFIGCLRYVTRNAVRHRIVGTVEAWPHTSYHVTLDAGGAPTWIARDLVLEVIGGVEVFRSLMERDDPRLAADLIRAFGEEEGVRRAVDEHDLPWTVLLDVLGCSHRTLERRLASGRRRSGPAGPLTLDRLVGTANARHAPVAEK